MNKDLKTAFEEAGKQAQSSLVGEFIAMLKQNKKYWLIPILIMLLIFGVLIVFGSSAAAPFIYTLF